MAPSYPERFDRIRRVEPLDCATHARIAMSLGPARAALLHYGSVDLEAGVGVIHARCLCLWLRDGRRITLDTSADGYLGVLSKGADPDKPRKDKEI